MNKRPATEQIEPKSSFARLCRATLVDSDEEGMGEPSFKNILEAIRSVDKKLENKVDALATTGRELREGQHELRGDVSRHEDRVTSLERTPGHAQLLLWQAALDRNGWESLACGRRIP
eukprot:202563-Amphidinium_carterae.1